ncbi:MAG TPA: GIY-YIG nuclease family protein [Candidatus Binataceae bacterium]|nr:GIY-YIG nuclease family protein [Candidatus Binataceae bacterium]
MAQGFVYILVSPNSSYIKIGGTEKPIRERLRAINGTASYADHGPWELSDFLHVTDWRAVEGGLHRHFQKKQIRDVDGTRELFKVPPHDARTRLRLTDVALRVGRERTEQVFKNADLELFLYKLFELSGLFGNLDIQGAWTLTVLSQTKGGRWFTLNIGPHEVAFSVRKAVDNKFWHYLVLDKLILEYPDTVMWIGRHDGEAYEAPYRTARERALTINFLADFAEAEKVFNLRGVRRALVAYWFEALADLRERDVKSVYARYHSYDAVSELLEYKRAREEVFSAAAKH